MVLCYKTLRFNSFAWGIHLLLPRLKKVIWKDHILIL